MCVSHRRIQVPDWLQQKASEDSLAFTDRSCLKSLSWWTSSSLMTNLRSRRCVMQARIAQTQIADTGKRKAFL